MSVIKARQKPSGFSWEERPPMRKDIVNAKNWVKVNIFGGRCPVPRFVINTMLQKRMRRIVKLWADGALHTHNSADVFFCRQDFLHNKSYVKRKNDLWATSLVRGLNAELAWRVRDEHYYMGIIKGIERIDKDIDWATGMVIRGYLETPWVGEKLMYKELKELSKITNSVYSFYAPNVK